MPSLPGGAADKLSNSYEHLWTVFRASDVMMGTASHIRLEPPLSAGRGVEFTVRSGHDAWGEQVKDASSGGSWTPHRLIREGVLPAVGQHLQDGVKIRLVLSTDAPSMQAIVERARKSESLKEFQGMIGDRWTEFLHIQGCWGVSEELARVLLKDLYIEHHPPESLRRLVSMRFERLIIGDPEDAIALLRKYFEARIHESVTGVQLWDHLASKGFPRRLLAGDTNTVTALAATVEQHSRRLQASAPTLMAVDPHARLLSEYLRASGCPQIVICHGKAGAGKSTTAARAVGALRAQGWHTAALSMERADTSVQTAASFGQRHGLTDSPAVLLAGVANGDPALLLVDQLDAVSMVSGRMPDVYYVIDELLDQVKFDPNLKVVLVTRSIDLERDPRFNQLTADKDRVRAFAIDDLASEAVKDALSQMGVAATGILPSTLELLRVPLHLAVFSKLSPSAQMSPHRSLQDLYQIYSDERRAAIERRVGELDWAGITSRLCRHMSENETVAVPPSVLDSCSRIQVSALESEGVLVREEGRIRFFHETFFDYVFARAFVDSGDDLVRFLLRSGQPLFRRTQVKQVLEYMASTDRRQFRRSVRYLLSEPQIRAHLREVVVDVLAALDEVEVEDWTNLDALAWDEQPASYKIRDLLGKPAWFDAADTVGHWQNWLADPHRVDRAFQQLAVIARQRPERTEQLVRPHIGASEAWRHRLRSLVEWSLTPQLVNLAADLMALGYLDQARGPIAVNSDFWSILRTLAGQDSEGAARLAGGYLTRQFERSRADGKVDPFGSGYIENSTAGGEDVIETIAARAPAGFVRHVLPFVIVVAMQTAEPMRETDLPAGHWGDRQPGSDHGIAEAIFSQLENALRNLAASAEHTPHHAIDLLRDLRIDELQFLVCRIYTAGDSVEGLAWLLSDDSRLCLGWTASRHWATRELIEAGTQHCPDQLLARLGQRLLGYFPRWELTHAALRWRGWAQYELLSAIAQERQPAEVRRRLGELSRKFAGFAPVGPKRQPVSGSLSPSIPAEAAPLLKDTDWRRVLLLAKSPERRRPSIGSSDIYHLSQLLGGQAARNPHRFIALASSFDVSTPAFAWEVIIRSVAPVVDIRSLSDLCRQAMAATDSAVARTVCAVATQRATDVDDQLADLLIDCSFSEDPSAELARTTAGSGGSHYGGDFHQAGMNSVRGGAAIAMGAILFRSDVHLDRLLPAITRLANDQFLAVRACAAEPVTAILNYRPHIALDIAEQLFAHDDPDVYDALSTQDLLTYAVLRDGSRFGQHLAGALSGLGNAARRAGAVWAVAAMNDRIPPPCPVSVTELALPARRGAASMLARDIRTAATMLAMLFHDDDSEVRKAASHAMRSIAALEHDAADDLIKTLITSPSFREHSNHLILGLDRVGKVLPHRAIDVAEHAVDIDGKHFGDIRTHHVTVSQTLIEIVLRLYRQGDTTLRNRCLDVIDRLAEHGAYGLTAALDSVR